MFIGIGNGLTLGQGGGLNLDAYLASLSGGFRFNFRKTDRFFQDVTLTTLADDIGEPISYALDSCKWQGRTYPAFLAGQPELVVNGNFDTDLTGWNSVNTSGVASGQSTLSLVSNRLRNTADGNSLSRYATQRITGLTVGDSLFMTGVFNRQTQAWTTAQLRTSITSGTSITSVATNFASGDVSFSYLSDPTTQSAYNLNIISAADTAGLYADFDTISLKAIPGQHGRQSSATLRPVRQTAGAKFDGSDDNLLTSYLASAGSNFLMARTTVPSSLAGIQTIAGASGASGNRIFIGVNTSGLAVGGIGSDSTGVIVGTTDLRNQEADIGITCNGTTVRLIVNGAVEYEAAQNSTPITTIPFRLGVHNNNGTPAANYYAGYIKECLAGTDYLTLAKFNEIRSALDRAT